MPTKSRTTTSASESEDTQALAAAKASREASPLRRPLPRVTIAHLYDRD